MSLFFHNIRVAVRNLHKYRLQTAVSIVSLSLGMVFFALTALWLRHERGYDTFYKDADNMYLLVRNTDGNTAQRVYVSHSMPAGVAERHPQIESFTRTEPETVYSLPDYPGELVRGRSVDEHFMEFFDVKVLEGDSRLILRDGEIAITKACADRLFGGDAIGRKLHIAPENPANGTFLMEPTELTVKAVIENPRQPSTFRYDYLHPHYYHAKDDYIYSTISFVKVSPDNIGTLAAEIEKDSYDIPHDLGISEYVENSYSLVPIKDVRAGGYLDTVIVRSRYVLIFMLLSVIMIIIALVNFYTMLATRIGIRGREISLRIANGAKPYQVISMFGAEILLTLLAALAVGAVACGLGLPYFMKICLIERSKGFFILSYLLYSAIVGAVALVIASVIVAVVGKRRLNRSLGKGGITPSAVGYRLSIGFQLAVSLCTILCSVIITSQVRYLNCSEGMGFRKKNMGYVYQFGMYDSEVESALAKYRSLPEIDGVVYGFRAPTSDLNSSHSLISKFSTEDEEHDYDNISVVMVPANGEYLEILGVQPVAGTLFTESSAATDRTSDVVINEAAAQTLGFTPEEAVGKTIYHYNNPCHIIGVVTDLCYLEPTVGISPLMFKYSATGNRNGMNADSWFIFRYRDGLEWTDVAAKANAVIEDINPNAHHYSGNVLEEYKEYISSEIALGKFLTIVTIVCIVIAVCGVFSIVSLACERRRREIAVRKISGARARDIMGMFLKEYLGILVSASVIAFPAGYLIMHRWLSVYVKQVPVTVWMFLGIFAGMAFLMTVTILHRIRVASRQNPAMVVRSE